MHVKKTWPIRSRYRIKVQFETETVACDFIEKSTLSRFIIIIPSRWTWKSKNCWIRVVHPPLFRIYISRISFKISVEVNVETLENKEKTRFPPIFRDSSSSIAFELLFPVRLGGTMHFVDRGGLQGPRSRRYTTTKSKIKKKNRRTSNI